MAAVKANGEEIEVNIRHFRNPFLVKLLIKLQNGLLFIIHREYPISLIKPWFEVPAILYTSAAKPLASCTGEDFTRPFMDVRA